MQPVTLVNIVQAIQGRAIRRNTPDTLATGIAHDSRQVKPGDVFWALSGETHDGHNFLEQAETAGAIACVVQSGRGGQARGPLIEVDSPLQALLQFAAWYRNQQTTRIIGVTGSVGKTTTRELIHAALSGGLTGMRSQKNYNTEIGVPLTLLELRQDHHYAVVEMGARRIGDIQLLAETARPEIGVITAIAPAHLETFGDLEGVLQGKGELLEALPASGWAILSGDHELPRRLAPRARCRVLWVGEMIDNHVRASGVEVGSRGLSFRVDQQPFEVPIWGRQALTGALAAVAIGREFGLTDRQIAAGLQQFQPVSGRGAVRVCGDWTVIDDTYNASPASMRAACELLGNWPGASRRILVLGEMRELGPDTRRYHQELGAFAAGSGVDVILAYGERASDVVHGACEAGFPQRSAESFEDLRELQQQLRERLVPMSVVLVKGSRSMRMERVVDWLEEWKTEGEPTPVMV